MILLSAVFLMQAPLSVGGTVVDSITQRPLTKTKIIVSSETATPAPRNVTTGSDGRFRFENVPAGKYTLTAERIGYIRQTYGQRTLYARYRSAIIVSPDQKTDEIIFRLNRGGVLTGKITEPNGDPIPDMIVHALQIAGIGKGRRVTRSSLGTTDDRGIYRIPFLPQAKFAVVVTGGPNRPQARPSTEHIAYPATYYPGSANPDDAALIEVRHGQESVADLMVAALPAARVNGQVAGSPSQNRYASLSSPGLFGYTLFTRTSPSLSGNTFVMDDIPPGRYILTMTQDGTRRGGGQRVDVNAPETSVTINETPPAQVTAIVKIEGPRRTSAPTIRLVSLDTGAAVVQRGFANGVATFDAVQPGRYEPFAIVERKEAAVVNVKAQGKLLAPDSVIIVPETGKLDLELTVDTAAEELKGKVMCDAGPCGGALAMLVKRSGWESTGAFRFDQTDSDGSFRWRAVPPGEYMMFAFENIDAADYDDPAVIRQLLPGAQTLAVTGDARQVVTLNLTGASKK